MLGLLASGKVAVGDLEDDGDISQQSKTFDNKERRGSIPGNLSILPNTINKTDNTKPKTNSLMSIINDYKHKIREEMNATSTLAEHSQQSTEKITYSERDSANSSNLKEAELVHHVRKIPPSSSANGPPIKRVESDSDMDSFLKEPPMYYFGMAKSAAVSFFAKPRSTTSADKNSSKTNGAPDKEVEKTSNLNVSKPNRKEIVDCKPDRFNSAKKANANPSDTTYVKKDQVLDAMEFVEKAKNSAISLFSRSDDRDERPHEPKEDAKLSTIKESTKKESSEEAADIVDRAKIAAVSLFSKPKGQGQEQKLSTDSHSIVVSCVDKDEDLEESDIVIVQTNHLSASFDLYSSSLTTNASSSLTPRSRASSYDQVHHLATSLRKISSDSTYVTVTDMYSSTSEDDFIDHGFVPNAQDTIEEERNGAASPITPPKVRRNSVDAGDLIKSRLNLDHQDAGLFARAALSILPSRSLSDKDGTSQEREKVSFSSFLSSITSKKIDDDERTCDTMETPKKRSFASGRNDSEPFLKNFSPKVAALLNSRQSSALQEAKESRPSSEEILENLEAYVNILQSAEDAEKLKEKTNAAFEDKLNGNVEYWDTLSSYYAERPSLVKYTIEKELHRMNYAVRVLDGDSTVELTSTQEICDFLRAHKKQQCDGRNDESVATVDYLFRVANQSLLADPVEMLLKEDIAGPGVMRSVRVDDARFTIDTVDGYVRCEADLKVFLPLSEHFKDDDTEGDDISISSASTVSTLQTLSSCTCSEVELSCLQLSVTFALGLLEDGVKSHTAGKLDVAVNKLELSDKWNSNRAQFNAQLRNAAKAIFDSTVQ